ncbi:hypothetical protein Tco_0979233 [Tanacetum coccineum]
MIREERETGKIPTKIELTLEQSQQGVSDDVLVSIEGVEELKRNVWIKGEKKEALQTQLRQKPGQYIIYQNHKDDCWYKCRVAAPFQQSRIHYHVLILKLQKSSIQLKCNKNVISQKAQVHVKFSNSDNHELPHHQRSSKSNQKLSFEEIVIQRNI